VQTKFWYENKEKENIRLMWEDNIKSEHGIGWSGFI
jgi:hypothetical protein